MRKKLISAMLSALIILSLAGCGSGGAVEHATLDTEEAVTEEAATGGDSADEDEDIATTGDVADETIANGMRGTIVNIYDDKAIVVLFDIDEKLIVYSPDKYNNLSLAYVINFHKSQGAGIKNVICLITPLHKRVLSRNLLYVGQTRAKESLIEILDEYTYKKALTIDALSSRKTNLQLFLNKKN